MKRYAVVIEKTETGYGASVPDLPGCITSGETVEETFAMIKEAIEMHLEDMVSTGQPIPEPTTIVAEVQAA